MWPIFGLAAGAFALSGLGVWLWYRARRKRQEKLSEKIRLKYKYEEMDPRDKDFGLMMNSFRDLGGVPMAAGGDGPFFVEKIFQKDIEEGKLYLALMVSVQEDASYYLKSYLLFNTGIPDAFEVKKRSFLLTPVFGNGLKVKNVSREFMQYFVVKAFDREVKTLSIPPEIQDLLIFNRELYPLASRRVQSCVKFFPEGISITGSGTNDEGEILKMEKLTVELGRIVGLTSGGDK